MTNESREYPKRIWAGHLGGGRRIWKPELMHESEKAFACQYVRADAVEIMREALGRALAFIMEEAENRADAGSEWSDYEREPRDLAVEIQEAIALVDEAQSKAAGK